ncbi:ClC family H(+)/Cl(-) exchange transporter [Limosilactobacillus fastidiosus]|uniref:ClC family H(+)/Cl(-) exchange transporter n=1 Tax=Limosilactobacillus fastidiosus TaxID=2759855 RepID=A0A7W3U0D7_9LACO|nr:ClC family H(+)/Cl(-) exchange transporter [Limosilactobacillus fastidiosus]MBB1063118.1 ClC family H(+)/Cl(-) exchange transporter [Limosilactobacillus fastidiosus]MBB1086622.1 ClC family H(+)/Cl(-) exchange transporter [Limosilactobacillus fastidiosus]MCD7084134.1 ClC family H(+)/Cl(-) exchange transporter [Limosilactobacillus fastidiosus]MCD7086597.1 ClC family H(+)/Cl(-) exchange transporter [Limosilactobacillus fastidiosus]MCD7115305.1 ClC family H(+)/Cl(-) exchange transporter [Limosi
MDNQLQTIKRAKDILNRPMSISFVSLIIRGIFVGLITGLIVSIFRWIIDRTLSFLAFVYPLMVNHLWLLVPYILVTLLIVFLLSKILKPCLLDLVGSGVPQIEAVLLNEHHMNAGSVLWRKFVGGLLAICPGLFLGREGPCIQMGACVGQLFGEHSKTTSQEKRFLLECGVAAGLSAAFSAPLAGAIFLMEEITFNFQPQACITALASAISADLVTILFFGVRPCLYLPLHHNLPEGNYLWLIILGVILGILAYVYQYTLLNLRWWYSKVKLPNIYHSVIPLLLVIPIGLWNAKILGGSHKFIAYIGSLNTSGNLLKLLPILVVFLIIRFCFSMISYGASVPGGIFMPILVLGALLGAIAAVILIHQGIIAPSCFLNIVVISMAAYFGAIEEAPFTAITLLTEMVGSVDQVFPMAILTFIAYIISNLLGGQPIYASLRKEMFKK